MGKSTLTWIAITLTTFGAAITAGHPALGTITGLAILALGIGTAVGALPVRGQADDYILEPRVAGQKISNTLVALSSAAILAVYAAGYHRTGAAAERFEVQTARRSTAAPIAAGIGTPIPATLRGESNPTVPHSPARQPRKDDPRPSASATRVAAPLPSPIEQPPATPNPATIADPSAEPAAPTAVAEHTKYKDGTYLGWGSCRHGDIQASVVIQNGQIVSTAIATCATRYSCSRIASLFSQVVDRQGPKVDYVSGATQSSDAFSDAVSEALSKASE